MKPYIAIVAGGLWCFGLPTAAQHTAELPVSANGCAIYLALTGKIEPECPPPTQNLGVLRRVPETEFSRQAASLEPDSNERGYFIRFPFNSSDLTQEYSDHLQRLAKVVSSPKMAQTCIKLVGHTDTVGGPAFNQGLSSKRARMVGAYLAAEGGIDINRIVTAAMGESQPLPDISGAHPLNRRVEIMARHRDGHTCR